MSSSKPKKQVYAYKYRLCMDLAIGHGYLDAFRSIYFADKLVWAGNVRASVASQQIFVNQPGLFGGDDSEGGVNGMIELAHGSLEQELLGVNNNGTYDPNPSIDAYKRVSGIKNNIFQAFQAAWPAKAQQYRGIALMRFYDFYVGTSPYLKDISIGIERYWSGWYPEVAKVGVDANPAHIIYETIINDQWGLGYPAADLHEPSMRKSALQLFNEGFGISLAWSSDSTAEAFIGEILEHIDGDFFFDPQYGQWRLRLIREGDPVEFTFNKDNATITQFDRRGPGELINQLYVKYTSPESEEYVSVAQQDLACIQAQGQAVSSTKEYRGIRNETLALHVCQRDLQTLCSTLATIEMTVNRKAWKLTPGAVVVVHWPDLDIEQLQMRVTTLSYPSSETGDIQLTLMEDIFGRVTNVFNGDAGSGWEDERRDPTPFSVLFPWEVPFWFVAQISGAEVPDEIFGFGSVLAVSDNPDLRLVELRTRDSAGVYQQTDTGPSTPSALLSQALPASVLTDMFLNPTSILRPGGIQQNSYAVIGTGINAEIVRVLAVNDNGTYSLQRGMMDTHPRAWPIGTRVFFINETTFVADPAAVSLGVTQNYELLMQTSLGITPEADAQKVALPILARQGRPYPPNNIMVDGQRWPDTVDTAGKGSFEVTWSHRNRLFDVLDQHLMWQDPSVPPEEGTTYTVQLWKGTTKVLDFDGILGSGQIIPADGLDQDEYELRVFSVRDDMTSYQVFSHEILLLIGESSIDWPVIPFPGRRLAIIGDSISYENTLHVAGNGSRYEQYSFSVTGYWPKAAQLFNHRLELEPGLQPDLNGRHQGLNTAIAGSRVMNWWLKAFDNQNDGVLDQGPMYTALKNINAFDVAVIMGGTNDLSFNRTASEVLSDIKRAVSQIARAGKWVFVMTITARTTDLLNGYSLDQQAIIRSRLDQVNQGLKAWVEKAQPPNVWLVDAFGAVVGPNGIDPAGLVSPLTSATAPSVMGNYNPRNPGIIYMSDGLHPGPAGAFAIGEELAKVMIAAGVPPRDANTLGPMTMGPNILPNPTFGVTTAAPPTGKSSVLGRALGLGVARIDATHPPGKDSYSNMGIGYANGPMPDYWFFYRASNSDNESFSNFNAYMWGDLATQFPNLYEYVEDSTWTDGCARTSIVSVDGKQALRIDFRTVQTGNKNEAFTVRCMVPRGQHGEWDDYGDGDILVPNTVYAGGDQLAAEATVKLSNVKGLHTAIMTLEFLSVNLPATSSGDYSSAGAVITGTANGMNFWPPSDIDRIRIPTEDVTLQMRTAAVKAPVPAPGENHQYARLNFQFACDASEGPASVTLIIVAPSVNKLSPLDFPPTLEDRQGLGYELGENLGGSH